MLRFESIESLFDDAPPYSKDAFKPAIFAEVRNSQLAGYPEPAIEADFSPTDGSDILIKAIDLEKALGYSLFASPGEYYENLKATLFEPADGRLFGEIDG